ncbi:MAG: hypothetical protein ABSG89_10655 [Bacteroidales bacterium]
MNNNNSRRSILLPVLLSVTLVFGILLGLYLPRSGDLMRHTGIRARNDKINNILNFVESSYKT